MKRLTVTLALLAPSLALTLGARAGTPEVGPPAPAAVTLGVDVLLTDAIALVEGKRVGLVTNQSGVDGQLVPTSVRLADDPRVELVQLYAPEHGLRGELTAGERFTDTVDEVTGVPVEALFGKGRVRPSQASLARLDAVLFDIQDVGSRAYTYISTLGEVMEAAAEAKVPVIVLDRPNPQGGWLFEGPMRDPRRKSFVSWGPIPVTHGMTVGELARLYNAELDIGCTLHVVEMKGWRRSMTWEETGLFWVPTSPGIPHINAARVFPATGMFAGVTTNVNEGVGITWPFETIAAEHFDPLAFWRAMEEADLPGVRFRPITYRPYYHRFRRKILHGVQLVVTDPRAFRPIRTALTLMTTAERLYPKRTTWRAAPYVGRIWGTDEVLERVRAGATASELEASWAEELARFGEVRARHLIYE